MNDSEWRLIQKSKLGDKIAFSKLIKEHQEKMLYLAFDIVGNYEDAKDIAQESFLRAFEKIEQFEERARFSTWLYRITVNTANQFIRRSKKNQCEPLRMDMEILSDDINISAIENNQTRKQIEFALGKLSIQQRTASILKFFHHKSYEQIADILGCTETTARIHIFRALKKLRKLMKNIKKDLI